MRFASLSVILTSENPLRECHGMEKPCAWITNHLHILGYTLYLSVTKGIEHTPMERGDAMIVRKTGPYLLAFALISFLFTAGGCAKPPEQDMADARSAIENARSLKAEIYAFESYKKALEAHSKAQQAFEAKKYGDARKFAIITKEEADASILIARKNMESMKEAARKAIDVLDSTLAEVYRILENRKEEIANELEELDAGFDLVKTSYESGDYKVAGEKAERLIEKANRVMSRFEDSHS